MDGISWLKNGFIIISCIGMGQGLMVVTSLKTGRRRHLTSVMSDRQWSVSEFKFGGRFQQVLSGYPSQRNHLS